MYVLLLQTQKNRERNENSRFWLVYSDIEKKRCQLTFVAVFIIAYLGFISRAPFLLFVHFNVETLSRQH